jgi:methionyl-tRNA formyltransferase
MELRCVLVGVGALPVQCGELLLRRGHRIAAVVTQDARLERWAEKQGAPCFPPSAEGLSALAAIPCDCLLSIVNPWVLPAETLRLARRLAINYHDSLLPAYGGTHAATWALWAGEAEHGITWHTMEERVDRGDILKQERFAVAPQETSFTLNMKCYEAALCTFGALVEEIEADRLTRRPQAADGSFHRRAERPAGGGILSWASPAEELERQVRALDFAATPNPMGCAKIAAGERFVIVRRLEVLATPSTVPPGTVTGLAGTALQVSTASHDVALREVATVDGRPLGTADLLQELRLHRGYRFREIDAETAGRAARLGAALVPHEAAWASRLARLQPVCLPGRGEAVESGGGDPLILQLAAPVPIERLIAASALLIARLTGASLFDLGYRGHALAEEVRGLEGLFAASVPLRVDLGAAQTVEEAVAGVREALAWAERHRTFARDLVPRIPQLQTVEALRRQPKLDIRVEVVRPGGPLFETGGDLVLAVESPEDGEPGVTSACRLWSPAAPAAGQAWQHELAGLLAGRP